MKRITLLLIAVFVLSAVGFGQALDGLWYWDESPNDPDMALKLNNGKIDSEYLKGTYTTRNNEITYTITHYLGAALEIFGKFFVMSGARPFEWYSREQMGNLLKNHPMNAIGRLSAQDIKEMLDMMYPTETVPIIGGNRFTLDFLDKTYKR